MSAEWHVARGCGELIGWAAGCLQSGDVEVIENTLNKERRQGRLVLVTFTDLLDL